MTNTEKVAHFLSQASCFYFATTDGNQPKVRPFSWFTYLEDKDRIVFSTGKFKNAYKQLLANPQVEIFAQIGMKFLRYDGIATPIEDDKLKKQVRIDSPGIARIYDENGWETGMFYLENGHCEIRESLYPLEDFDI